MTPKKSSDRANSNAGGPYGAGTYGGEAYGGVVGNFYDRVNTVEDLDGLIRRQVRESETIEYKSATKRVSFDEVAKDISAFANASGGTIIYGIATDNVDKTKPVAIEPVLVENIEAIRTAISTHIRNPIPNVRAKTISDEAGNVIAFIVEVPESYSAPHQVLNERKYYRRDGVQSAPMPHDLIELLFRRRRGPALEPSYRLDVTPPQTSTPGWKGTFVLEFWAKNVGPHTARDVLLRLRFPISEAYLSHRYPNFAPALVKTTATEISLMLPIPGVVHPELPSPSLTIEFSVRDYLVDKPWPLLGIGIHAEDMKPIRRRVGLQYFDRERRYGIKDEETATDVPIDLNYMSPWTNQRGVE